MEILQKFKENGYFTPELYQLLSKKKLGEGSEEIIPSEYEKEMRLSTEERLQSLNNIIIDNIVNNREDKKHAVLSFTPRIIIFQNFKPNDKYVTKFSVKNISKVPTYLKMVFKESPYFSIKMNRPQPLSRLAPGISASFIITFIPTLLEDYIHKITLYTDLDKYIVPLIGMGPRPIFNFPDELTIPKAPLKVESNYLLTIRNVGMVPSGFTLDTKCPFSVQPKSAYLNCDEQIEIKVSFKTMHLGYTQGLLRVVYETGEKFIIKLSGTAHAVSVELEKQIIKFPETYNGMVQQQILKISNKSDYVLTYMCMKNECVYYDFKDKVKLATVFYNLKESEAAKCAKLVRYDVLSSTEHERVYTRIFCDEIQALVADETLYFRDSHYSISPVRGQLWPNKTSEITLTFSPTQIGELDAIAYFDIDGVADRIPLKLSGTSLPPSIHLNLETLDMSSVYINKKYNYEIIAINNGHINGVILYKESSTLFGSKITCTPVCRSLRPGEKDMFVISFLNSNPGPFLEEINFIIRDTDVKLKVFLKGEIIYPSVIFSVPSLDFGDVSLGMKIQHKQLVVVEIICKYFNLFCEGVPKTLILELINESNVHVSGVVKIPSDGLGISSITLTDYAYADHPKPEIPRWPREFEIEPSKIIMDPESMITLKVTLTANLIRSHRTALELELEKSDRRSLTLPITYNATIPYLTPAPNINLRACFLDYPYVNVINVTSNDFCGYFTTEEHKESAYDVNINIKEGFIEPNSTVSLSVTVKANTLGVHEFPLRLRLFGAAEPIEICHITVCGVRPIVTCDPIALHWGHVKLLKKLQKTLTLYNDSPLQLKFNTYLLNRDTKWQIEPREDFIEPESEKNLTVNLYLVDAETYSNKAVIQIENMKDILVPLTATGVGTSIVIGDLGDRIELGHQFTRIPLKYKVKMKNQGTKMHVLEWSEHYKMPKKKQQAVAFFNLEPRCFKMYADEELELTVTGNSNKVALVKETWYLVGSIEGINKKELLLECEVTAEFIDPKIEISSPLLDFQCDRGPYSEFYKLTDIITIKNISTLPLDLEINVRPPFAMIQKQNTYNIQDQEEDFCHCICYNESDLNLSNIFSSCSVRECNDLIDFLTLKPVYPLREGNLQFFEDINKIKRAFNLTNLVEQHLEDQEIMKVQILFDTTKHTSLKSRIYGDDMKIKFKGHKNKDCVKLCGRINFPNILVLTPKIEFQCLLNNSIESKTIKIQNTTPLIACYRFRWKKVFITSTVSDMDQCDVHYANNITDIKKVLLRTEPNTSNISEVLSQRSEICSVKITGNTAIASEAIKERNSEINIKLKNKIMKTIVPMIGEEYYDPKFKWISKLSHTTEHNYDRTNDMLLLIPHRGKLKPNEIQYVNVMFRPQNNINIRAVIECEVLGGPSEFITVTGQSSDLKYSLSTREINFKIRCFQENAYEYVRICNKALLPFDLKTYLNESKYENELNATILEVVPPEKVLHPDEGIDIKVIMRPGVLGYFKRVFLLEIGHQPIIPIEVFGWGVIPQVYLSIPRPNIIEINPTLGYHAIATLSNEYLNAVNLMITKRTSEHLNTPLIEKCFEDPMFQRGWHICSARLRPTLEMDVFPSIMDIEMSIERILLINYLNKHPEVLNAAVQSTVTRTRPISGFTSTPYVIDFGVVITGSTVHYTVEAINYGPTITKLHLSKNTCIPDWLSLKLCGKLNPGEVGRIDVTFSPTTVGFPDPEQCVETVINLEVPYGVTIPVNFKALCAVPYLVSNVDLIDFGCVKCGNKVIYSIPLKNIGKPTCIWYATLKLKSPGMSQMTVLDSSGKFEPGDSGWLNIAFKPTLEVTYEGLLIFRFHMNPKRMTIPIIGYGVLPKVHIIGPNISFPPTLPWAETTEYFFGLTNPCPFPIELIIAHNDTKWQEEEEIYQLLNKYYNKPEEMLVPAIKPGSGLPPEIREFYQKFKESIKKYAEEASKIFTTKTLSVKKTKSPKHAIKTTSQSLEVSPRHHRTEVEIIEDEIRIMKENKIDPLKDCLQEPDYTPTVTHSEKHSNGLIVLFHGSPCEEEQCQEMAYSVGKKLNLPTLSVDLCFVEALCVSNCQAKQTLNRVINEIYEVCKSGIDKEDINEQTEEINETIDEFETMLDKIKTITNNKTLATPKSRASEKRKKRSTSSLVSHTALEAMGSTTMFNLELIQELLTDFLDQPKFDRGFVIDSLTSAILRSPSIVLTTILKCKPTILNIHLVLCQSNFNKWAQTYEESQKDDDITEEIIHKEYSDSEIEEIINSFENMTDEEYENASPELRSIYILRGLEDRRRKHYLKAGVPKATVMKEKDTKGLNSMKSLLAVDKSESKKKIKKDDLKGKPTSEYLAMNIKYNDYYKNIHENLINIANNWIVEQCDLGSPLIGLSGQVVGQNQKKSKKKSELNLQVSEVSFTERGFPLTLITCPCINYKEAVVNMFASSPSLQNALRKTEKSDIFKHPIQKNEFTVLLPKIFPVMEEEESLKWVYLDEIPIKKCECNFINDLNVLDDLCQDNVLNILSKWNCSCGKKVISSQTSTTEFLPTSSEMISTDDSKLDITPYPLPLYKVKSIINREERIILQTGDLVRCKYTFSPKVEGKFNVKRFVQVNGWPASQVVVNVTGICDLPRLDNRPKKMFKNFVRRQIEDNVYKGTYLDDVKVFQFGPIFIGNNRKYEEKYVVDLKNASLITTDVDIEFLHESEVFRIDKKNIKLEPECRGKLIVSAAPAVIGEHKNVLLFCIKNNPEIVEVNIACSGVVPIVEILPSTKVIDYGKHLLYRREDDRFIVKNDSILPIMWKIRNANEFLENFIISQTSGVIPRHRNHVVPVTYLACKVEIISNKILLIDIYDSEGRGDPMIVDSLYLSAECYDVMVECAYENMDENLLNFGNVKVNLTVARQMYLFNRGKYNIYYKLKKVKNFPEPSLLKSFEVTPECGVLPATTKLVTVEFECMPTTSLNLVNVPVYTCSLLDDSRKQTIVAKFPICVTIASFYNTFTLFPLGELNFHVIPVGVGVLREVILNNTSKCPFTYEIILPSEYQVGPDNVQSTKGKDNKIKNPPLNCGNFVIMNEDNLLAPFTSRTIQIQFLATAAKTFEETIHFVVSDTCPAEANGVPLKLVGTGAIPTLDFWNLETTFREHLIVKNMSEYKVPEPSPHCVFVEDTVTLHFFGVVVNTNYIGAIDLYNNGLVPCALKIKLHYQSNSNQEIFSLDKYETHIEPLMHKNLNIIFSPKALEVYKAVLEVKLKKVESEEQSFRICLIGEGVIPRIRIIYPQIKKDKHTLLEFPVTCLGSITNRQISFKSISSINVMVIVDIIPSVKADRPLFWLTAEPDTDHIVLNGNNDNVNITLKVTMKPSELVTLTVHYSPLEKGKTNCEIKLTVVNNPFENYTILCNAEAFMEDVILVGLEMLSMDVDLETYKMPAECSLVTNQKSATSYIVKEILHYNTRSTASTTDTRKKNKSAQSDKKKLKIVDSKKSKRFSQASMKQSDSSFMDQAPTILKYLLDFGGCELCLIQRRSVIMVNNSEKVYKFSWIESVNIIVRPSAGYISPGEEKDLEVIFYSAEPVDIEKEFVSCSLTVVSDNSLTENSREITWDTRQTVTLFNRNRDVNLNERCDITVKDQIISPNNEQFNENISIVIIYSVKTEYTKYECDLEDEKILQDTFIYQTRCFNFKVKNVGRVPMKITWSFVIDDEFPIRITKSKLKEDAQKVTESSESTDNTANERDSEILAIEKNNENSNSDPSKITLFSESLSRESADTWFEIDLPFHIEPKKACLNPNENKTFNVIFSPLDAFLFKVRLQSAIDNLDPYDQNITCKITAKSLIPYVHLDIEESDYLTSGRRKATEVALPELTTVLEFKVLGAGCYKKSFNVINPTTQSYEFIFEVVMTEEQEFVPVHCNKLKGYVEGGTSTEVVFTFSPPSPGVYESQWKFKIPTHSLVMNLLVVGFVREPGVEFVPKILLLKNSLVGFTSETVVRIKNNENESLGFEFKGNSLCDESGETPVVIYPERGILKPHFETPIKISYTPIQDGPLSFKIFCGVKHLTKLLTLCVNALSLSIKPVVTYYLIGNEHILKSDAVTNIHLDKTASTYKRTIPFTIKNDGSATIFFDWHYSSTPVKKYLEVNVEPRMGHVSPGNEVECILYFHLIKVPVRAFPVSLSITDGPRYDMYLYAEIEKPSYHFSCMEYDFGMCFVNAPDSTYKKNIAFENADTVPLTLDLNFSNLPELYVEYYKESSVQPNQRLKISMYFRPKDVKMYEFKLQFWVNSLCEETVVIKGEGIPLLFDLYDGCQKSFDLGPVKVGDKIVRQIEVMNHSKAPIDASFIFRDTYPAVDDANGSEATSICLSPGVNTKESEPGKARVKMLQNYKDNKIKEQIALDVQNALSSLKVVPNKCTVQPYRKVPLKIQFKPIGLISTLNVQLNMKVFQFERPLVQLSGNATGMSLCLSQNSLQFGRVRKRSCKILKVMLQNKGDFSTRFWWQPLKIDEFTISPMQGNVAARSNVTFTVTFRPININPFIKVWASCNIENYVPLELALYATCVDTGAFQNKTLYMECPVRETQTDHIVVTNPTDEMWLVLSEVSGESFETLKEFNIEANTTFEIPIHFKPKSFGKHEGRVLFSPLGESALFINVVGIATRPNPNGDITLTIKAKDPYTEELLVYNITEFPESYVVSSEILKVVPDKFDGYYEIKHPETVKVWGEATATCRWTFVCYEECEMNVKVRFTNEKTREYQFYNIAILVTPSGIMGTLTFESRARESVQKELSISNPLAEDTEFNIHCEHLESPDKLMISRNSKATLSMTYSPLVVGVTEEYLEVSNPLVGTYLYKVILKCLPAKEKNLEFTTPLGTSVPLRLRAHNKTDTRAEFTATVSHPSIIVEKEYALDPFEKGKFQAWFEPTEIGRQVCRVSLKSAIAGEFVYNIQGIATEPKPQGPYEVKSGGSTTIRFKNVFEGDRVFKLSVDRKEFYVKSSYESLKPKKDLKVAVYLNERPAKGWKEIPTGCLTIECHEPAEPNVQWTYFLKGIL